MAEKTRLERVLTNNILGGVYNTDDGLRKPKIDLTTFSEDVDVSGEVALPPNSITLEYVRQEVFKNPETVIIHYKKSEALGDDGYSEDLDLQPLNFQATKRISEFEERTLNNCFDFARMGREELENDPSIGIFASRLNISSRRLVKIIFVFAPRHDISLISHP